MANEVTAHEGALGHHLGALRGQHGPGTENKASVVKPMNLVLIVCAYRGQNNAGAVADLCIERSEC
jgi:hypothetical protein